MSAWSLLAFIFLVWILWAIAGTVQTSLKNRHLPESERGGFSFAPVIPFFPLLLWFVALSIDYFASPWGSRLMAALHAIFGAAAIFFIAQFSMQLRHEK